MKKTSLPTAVWKPWLAGAQHFLTLSMCSCYCYICCMFICASASSASFNRCYHVPGCRGVPTKHFWTCPAEPTPNWTQLPRVSCLAGPQGSQLPNSRLLGYVTIIYRVYRTKSPLFGELGALGSGKKRQGRSTTNCRDPLSKTALFPANYQQATASNNCVVHAAGIG